MRISRYIAIAVVAGAMLSCTKSEDKPTTDPTIVPIGFAPEFAESKSETQTEQTAKANVSTSKNTRGTVIDQINARTIGVYAYFTTTNAWSESADPNVLDNTLLGYDNGSWVLPKKIYWPADTNEKISFFAYAPRESRGNGIVMEKISDAGAPYTVKGTPKLKFEVLWDVMNHTDLLICAPQKNLNKEANSGIVKFEFKHVLTKVGFKAFCRTPNTTLRSLTISNLPYSGTIPIDGNNIWTVDAEKRDLSIELSGLPISSDETLPTDISAPGNFFFLLPQNHSTTKDAVLTVVYVERNEVITKSTVITENWGIGKSVTYKLDFGGSATDELTIIDVDIKPWEVEDRVEIGTK